MLAKQPESLGNPVNDPLRGIQAGTTGPLEEDLL
jgi:hypothetical protein